MHVLVYCKNEADPIENEEARVLTTFRPLYFKVLMDLFRRSKAAKSTNRGRMEPNFELVRDIMIAPLTCKNADPIKNEGASVLTKLYFNFHTLKGT